MKPKMPEARAGRSRRRRCRLDAEGGGGLRGVRRRQPAGVVDAVGQQDHDLRFGLGIAQAVHAGSDGVADGRGVLEHAGLQAVHLEHEPGVVGGQRRDGVGHGGEGDDAEAVVGPRLDELREHGLGGVEAVHAPRRGGKVVRAHGRRGVHDQHDVDAFGFHARLAHALLRAGGGGDQEDEAGGEQRGRQPAQRQPRRRRQARSAAPSENASGACRRRA
jgi:hypothetical protein